MVRITSNFRRRFNQALSESGIKATDLAIKTGLSKVNISQYRNGYAKPKDENLVILAEALNVDPVWLMGVDVPMRPTVQNIENIAPIGTQRLPVLGSVACGEPKFAEENLEYYVDVTTKIKADFVLHAKGDSMIGARIHDGDIVFVRRQPTVENGEIAVVSIDDEATLKRFYKYEDLIVLRAENPAYKDIEIRPDDTRNIQVLGKAVAFQSDVR